MKRIISTHYTYIYKILLPIVMIFALLLELFYILIVFYQFNHFPNLSHHSPIWIVGGGFLAYSYVVGIRLKKISVDRNILYISNYRSEISISISDIKAVYTFFFPYFTWIRLNEKSRFGNNIFFMPISYSTCLDLKSEVMRSTASDNKEHSKYEEKSEKKFKKRYLLLLLAFIFCVSIFFLLNL